MLMYLQEKIAERNFQEMLKKCWFHIALMTAFSTSIIFLMLLDYLNIESFSAFNNEFRFLSTWKGRMFYLFFLWLFLIESVVDWSEIIKKKPRNRLRILLSLIFAFIPLSYVLSVTFLSLNLTVLNLGQKLGFTEWSLNFHWVLCVEYVVFSLSFLIATSLAYKREGLRFFSIALSLLLSISFFYTIDTFYPGGTLKPFEMLTLPTAACAAAILDILGYDFSLSFNTRFFNPTYGPMPIIDGVGIGWPCAGVHSLFLFTIIIMLLYKKSNISTFRKFVYFVTGAFCTYFVNILRIVSYFVILWNNGENAARFFHNSVGELYFISWIFIYILIIISIERFRLIEKVRVNLRKIGYFRNLIKSLL